MPELLQTSAMCGRFTMTAREPSDFARRLGVDPAAFANWKPRYNVAPTQPYFILTLKYESRIVRPARWGLINSWARDDSRASRLINAKAETVDVLPSFRAAFRSRRCVVPADGFYEWSGPKGRRQPLWLHPRDGGLLLFAGLYESWHRTPDQSETTFTIITCPANELIVPIHDRMPVILNDRDAEDWMNPLEQQPRSLKRLLVPAPADLLVAQPVSPLVNSVSHDGPELLESPQGPSN
jgi:putative SOS response-associated peptidase YedK